MADSREEDTRGYISREHTVWCGLCCEWHQVAEHSKRVAAEIFKSLGWRYTRKDGWRCPNCVKEHETHPTHRD